MKTVSSLTRTAMFRIGNFVSWVRVPLHATISRGGEIGNRSGTDVSLVEDYAAKYGLKIRRLVVLMVQVHPSRPTYKARTAILYIFLLE